MTKRNVAVILGVVATVGVAAGCASMLDSRNTEQRAAEMLRASFAPRGEVKLDRLDQDRTQKACSEAAASHKPVSKDIAAVIERDNRDMIRWPANGQYFGDWRAGERIAQSGVGKQFSDGPGTVAGGNCYACHQLTKEEISYGTMGPSLYNYGKVRGTSAEVIQYTWGKLWNSEAYSACSNMPRFGHSGILTEAQIRDLVSLLLDPNSPVNK